MRHMQKSILVYIHIFALFHLAEPDGLDIRIIPLQLLQRFAMGVFLSVLMTCGGQSWRVLRAFARKCRAALAL